MTPAQRNRGAALLKATGYEDGPALTLNSTDGEIPHGRELSFAWLAGTVMTGLTSVLLMGAALYVSFNGEDNFSTAYEALQIVVSDEAEPETDLAAKTDRVRPVAATRSERETVIASIMEAVDGRDMIRKQPFVRVRATLATAATSLSEDVPAYDPVEILTANLPITAPTPVNTEIYGADVEGEVSIRRAAMPLTLVPPRAISDQTAADFVRLTVEGAYAERDQGVMAYAALSGGVQDLGVVSGMVSSDIAENVTVVPRTISPDGVTGGRTERILTVKEQSPLEDVLLKNGFTEHMIGAIAGTLRNVYPSVTLPAGARLRILFGPNRTSDTLIPYRLSIYINDQHAATVALTDRGQYVLGVKPGDIEFPEEDTEEINVNTLPTVYRSIWETARKHDIDDDTARRIVAMFAYDIDMNRRIEPGDTIELLQTEPDAQGNQELLYVSLKLGSSVRELFRFRTADGVVDFYDASGETGKRFLTRRPLQGGGRLSSRFGYRTHPIFKSRRLHSGVDLAAPRGTPIYASGDGTVERAGWVSGYGRYVELDHVNGYSTGYGHMHAIADGIKPGVRVRQGQVIGYVGSTGYSTGNHLHFEIKINGRPQDPLSVRLPRDKTLPAEYRQAFNLSIEQIRDLMERDAAPVTVAAAN